MKKIGLLGGTFDPIHYGHINMAIEVLEAKALDEVWFCPSRINPHKLHKAITPAAHRLELVKRGVAGLPNMGVIDRELKREGPSYMVDTLKELVTEFPLCQFGLILGDDTAANFYSWRDPELILTLADVYVYSRGCEGKKIPDTFLEGIVVGPILEICSTEIRKRIIQGHYCGHLVPQPVLDYIHHHHLYTS